MSFGFGFYVLFWCFTNIGFNVYFQYIKKIIESENFGIENIEDCLFSLFWNKISKKKEVEKDLYG